MHILWRPNWNNFRPWNPVIRESFFRDEDTDSSLAITISPIVVDSEKEIANWEVGYPPLGIEAPDADGCPHTGQVAG